MRNSNIYFSNIFRKFIIHKQAQEREERFKFKPIHLPSGPKEHKYHTWRVGLGSPFSSQADKEHGWLDKLCGFGELVVKNIVK